MKIRGNIHGALERLSIACGLAAALATSASAQDTTATQAAEAPPPNDSAGMVAPSRPSPQVPVQVPLQPTEPVRVLSPEQCGNRNDDDGDDLVDCEDADCFDNRACEAGGSEERDDRACHDWVDNDGDGSVDCDDEDCRGPGVHVCGGSADPNPTFSLPILAPGESPDDLVGRGPDSDGEHNDFLCSDGADNDGDGRIDCADYGCQLDPGVSVCHGSPGIRFSVVAGIGAAYDFEAPDSDNGFDVRFTRLQLRALGPIPYIQDSFFLLNLRAERTPRLTFAHFQIPIGTHGHYAAINSGGGNLSSGLIVSAAKQPLLDPPFYLFRAFEQGNGAAMEVGGPLTENGLLRFRAFAAGGSGEFNGNVGGRFFRSDDRNFSYTAGAQLAINFLGFYDRFDSAYLYTPAPLTLAMLIGGKYDQRPSERYPAGNAFLTFRYSHLSLRLESYTKYVFDYDSLQTAWNAQAVVLLVPRMFMLAADIGQFYAGRYDNAPDFDATLPRPLDELQWRAALHWFFYRNVGVLALVYREAHIEENPDRPADPTLERELRLEAQFRF